MSRNHSKENKHHFLSYSKFLKDNKQSELNQLQKTKLVLARENDSELFINCSDQEKTIENDFSKSKSANKEEDQNEKESNYKIDEKASVIRGKLVYL